MDQKGNKVTDVDTNIDRAERFTSHALVEVRKHKWLPFGTHSAVLLDISATGFKVEFTGEVKITPGAKFYLHIPLTPLGIHAPQKLFCKIECKWFDERRYRFGGVFLGLEETDLVVISQIVESLKSRGVATL